MRLNITDVRPEDFGEYECVSKNDINTTSATFFIYGNLFIFCIKYDFRFLVKHFSTAASFSHNKNTLNRFLYIFFFHLDGARHPTRTFSDIAVFGTLPPKPISYNDFCPPPNCPNCENRCTNAYIHHRDIEIRQLHFDGIRFPGIKNRTFGMCVCAIQFPH